MEKTTNKNTTPTTFADLVKKYNADPRNADHLTDLATAVAYSVLRKVIDPTRKTATTTDRPSDSGLSPALVALRGDLTRDRAYLNRLDHAVNDSTRLTFNADGDMVFEVIDPALAKAATDLAGQTLGDGLDLVNDAVLAILEETARQADRDPGMPVDLERAYTVRRLKRKVWIKTADSVNGWETVETTPIQEVFKAVRRSVQNSRHMQIDPRSGYTYLEDLAIDPETGDGSTIYRRLPKFADLGGHVCDFNGKETVATTADRETVATTDRLVAAMGLTDREMTVLKYRLAGYGYKAIATAMGLTVDNAKRCGRRIRDKATAAGLTPTAAVK